MDYSDLPNIPRIPLSEKVYRVVMNSIVEGHLAPGTELKEQHLAKQIGVSATPVREALKRLASDGLVEIIPYRGAVVKSIDYGELRDAYACREVLEHFVLQQSILRFSPADIAELREIVQSYLNAVKLDDIFNLSTTFDDIIYAKANNPTLTSILLNLRAVTNRDRKFSSSNDQRKEEIFCEHTRIIDAIESKNLVAAQAAVSNHLKNGYNNIKKLTK